MNFIKKSFTFLLVFSLFYSCNSAPSTSKPANSPKLYVIEIKDMSFQPAELSVMAGDTVEWVNKDIVIHDVTEQKSKKWTSGVIASGSSWKKVITNSDDYFCSIHVVMKGKLEVTPED